MTDSTRTFRAIFARDIKSQLFSGGQIALFVFLLAMVFLFAIAPKIVDSANSGGLKIQALANNDTLSVVSILEPEWEIEQIAEIPGTLEKLEADVAVVIENFSIRVYVEKSSQIIRAAAVAERFSTALLASSSGNLLPEISYDFEVDDGDLVLIRFITVLTGIITFTIIMGRSVWAFSMLSRDVSLGLFDTVFARSSAAGFLNGRLLATVIAGIIQMLLLAVCAAAMLALMDNQTVASRILNISIPLSLWAGMGIALFSVLAMVLTLFFRNSGAAMLNVALQMISFGAFGVLMFALFNPGATWIAVASVIPPTSVLLLPVRLTESSAAISEALLGVGLMAAIIFILFFVLLRVLRVSTTAESSAEMWTALIKGRKNT